MSVCLSVTLIEAFYSNFMKFSENIHLAGWNDILHFSRSSVKFQGHTVKKKICGTDKISEQILENAWEEGPESGMLRYPDHLSELFALYFSHNLLNFLILAAYVKFGCIFNWTVSASVVWNNVPQYNWYYQFHKCFNLHMCPHKVFSFISYVYVITLCMSI